MLQIYIFSFRQKKLERFPETALIHLKIIISKLTWFSRNLFAAQELSLKKSKANSKKWQNHCSI
ncbi:hypothetical protein B7486_39040 [cyanobacterium TDX16]|nr:hypothetical protein B7486_39040 [cyanobacterium TDX16]